MMDNGDFFKQKHYPAKDKGGYWKAVSRPDEVRKVVPWAYMTFKQIEENGLMAQLRVWMIGFVDTERREGYRQYLISQCAFPRDWQP